MAEVASKRKRKEAKRDAKKQKRLVEARESPRPLPTLTIAVPGSVIDNCQTLELATVVAGQLARCAAVFRADEVVVIDDSDAALKPGVVGAGAAFLARVLQYMETPQYLRRALIPMDKSLAHVGLLPPLDAPHHLRTHDWAPFREAVAVRGGGPGTLLDVGLDKPAHVPQAIAAGARITLRLGPAPDAAQLDHAPKSGAALRPTLVLRAEVATPQLARKEMGTYWGYTVRIAAGLGRLFSGCPFQGGYDVRIGTSERGSQQLAGQFRLPPYKHLLVAFGGPEGLEHCLQMDASLPATKSADGLFDFYINTCSDQGSRTIRTEEATFISMTYLSDAIASASACNQPDLQKIDEPLKA